MPGKIQALSHCLLSTRPEAAPVAYHLGQYQSRYQFESSVKFWAAQFELQAVERYALYTEDAYPFAIFLFALLQAGKQVWIPGNNRPGTAESLRQHCQLLGDWQGGSDNALQHSENLSYTLTALNPLARQIVIFTSGSTGEAKPILKCLQQFQLEIEALENQWGGVLGNAMALATVSHQHIYGLLFRVLWPLSAGRCFYSQMSLNPEFLVHALPSGDCYWVASPAHLKRLDAGSPWQGIAQLNAVFSSGGALPEQAARQIKAESGQAVIEVYGSSETGGIAWRQSESAWTLFPGMGLSHREGRWVLSSPYLRFDSTLTPDVASVTENATVSPSEKTRSLLDGQNSQALSTEAQYSPLPPLKKGGRGGFKGLADCLENPPYTPFPKGGDNLSPKNKCATLEPETTQAEGEYALDDEISLLEDGRFILKGRVDRIVKVEEKRLSLTELEQRLQSLAWIKEAYALVIRQARDTVAVALVLTPEGIETVENLGRNKFVLALRKALEPWFEPVHIPRKWLVVNTLPLTVQGKIRQDLLTALLDFDKHKFPQVHSMDMSSDGVQLGLKVPPELVYFPDHFAGTPVLPGVVQLAWVQHYAKLFFTDQTLSQLEALKFNKIIQPGDELMLTLNWKTDSGVLYFKFSSALGMYSSGRMMAASRKIPTL